MSPVLQVIGLSKRFGSTAALVEASIGGGVRGGARPERRRQVDAVSLHHAFQCDLGYDLIGLSAPTTVMPCSLVPWFQEYEVQLGGTCEIIRRKRPQRLSHGRLRRLTGKFSASCGQFFVVVRS